MNAKWNVVKNVKIVDGDGRWVASACKQGWTTEQQAHANAQLIAAAPELLEALKRVRDTGVFVGAIAKEMMDSAIARAEGKQ